jgi:hypothetical protein
MQTSSLPQGWAIADIVLKAITALGTLFVVALSLVLTARSKRADMFVDCRRRFEEINSSKKQLRLADPKPLKHEVLEWYSTFWGHQQDQFNFWQKGYIDDATFHYWCGNRDAERTKNETLSWRDGANVGTTSYREGWDYIKSDKQVFDPRFIEFVNDLWSLPLKGAIAKREPKEWGARAMRFLGGD